MVELKAMCGGLGFTKVRTYIASGNVIFTARQSASTVKAALKARLLAYAGKPVGVAIRTPEELALVLKANPFHGGAPNRTVAIFLDDKPATDALDRVSGRTDEELRLGQREIYVAYGAGMGRSRLKIPAAANGTARNINTITKLVELAAGR